MSLELVEPKRQLKVKMKVTKIVADLKEEFKDLSPAELAELKVNPELIKYVCNLVEVKIKKKHRANKKEVVLSIVNKFATLTEPERKKIEELIEFLHGNGDIKDNTILRYLSKYVWHCVKKKLTV